MRQPDMEIYLKDADVDHKAIAAWLGRCTRPVYRLGPERPDLQVQGRQRAGDLAAQGGGQMEQPVPGKDQTGMDDDIACARAAFAALNVEVRCAPGTQGGRR